MFQLFVLTKIDREIFSKVKFAIVTLETGKAPLERRDNELCYISISFIFGVQIYVGTIHNTTEETSREEYVSTIEYEKIIVSQISYKSFT